MAAKKLGFKEERESCKTLRRKGFTAEGNGEREKKKKKEKEGFIRERGIGKEGKLGFYGVWGDIIRGGLLWYMV